MTLLIFSLIKIHFRLIKQIYKASVSFDVSRNIAHQVSLSVAGKTVEAGVFVGVLLDLLLVGHDLLVLELQSYLHDGGKKRISQCHRFLVVVCSS